MRYSMLMLAIAGACLVQAQPKGGGAPLDLVGDLKQNYTAGKNKILAAAEEMPDAGYAFQPVPEERNFGQWVAHVADLQATVLRRHHRRYQTAGRGGQDHQGGSASRAEGILRDVRRGL